MMADDLSFLQQQKMQVAGGYVEVIMVIPHLPLIKACMLDAAPVGARTSIVFFLSLLEFLSLGNCKAELWCQGILEDIIPDSVVQEKKTDGTWGQWLPKQ